MIQSEKSRGEYPGPSRTGPADTNSFHPCARLAAAAIVVAAAFRVVLCRPAGRLPLARR